LVAQSTKKVLENTLISHLTTLISTRTPRGPAEEVAVGTAEGGGAPAKINAA